MRNHRLTTAVLTASALLALTGCSSSAPANESSGGPSSNSTSAAAAASEEANPAEVTPLALNEDGMLGGDATVPDFDSGEPGVVSTVELGQLDANSGSQPFVFRNNTSEAISHVDATATVRDADGAMTANGTSQGSVPAQIQPGGLGLAYIYFDQGEVPEGATFDYTFDTAPADTSSFNTGDLKVTEVSTTEDGIIGTAVNQTDATQSGPFSIDVYCFDASGTLLSSFRDYANEDGDVEPEGTVSFSTNFYGDECPSYLAGVTGYFK